MDGGPRGQHLGQDEIDPSERSKLPAMIVSVTAHAATPIVAFWETRLSRLFLVRKTDEAIVK